MAIPRQSPYHDKRLDNVRFASLHDMLNFTVPSGNEAVEILDMMSESGNWVGISLS